MASENQNSSTNSSKGVVYILTNPAMPGLVKIGKTSRAAEVRMDQLYSTGVPVPCNCLLAVEVEDMQAVEKALHIAFFPYRINKKREFFKIDGVQAKAVLEQLGTKDVTPDVESDNKNIDTDSLKAGERLSRSRRPNFNFEEMGIPKGAILQAVHSDHTVTVVNEKSVEFEGEVISLTEAAKRSLNVDYAPAPATCWQYEGKKLRDIYNSTYEDPYFE